MSTPNQVFESRARCGVRGYLRYLTKVNKSFVERRANSTFHQKKPKTKPKPKMEESPRGPPGPGHPKAKSQKTRNRPKPHRTPTLVVVIQFRWKVVPRKRSTPLPLHLQGATWGGCTGVFPILLSVLSSSYLPLLRLRFPLRRCVLLWLAGGLVIAIAGGGSVSSRRRARSYG